MLTNLHDSSLLSRVVGGGMVWWKGRVCFAGLYFKTFRFTITHWGSPQMSLLIFQLQLVYICLYLSLWNPFSRQRKSTRRKGCLMNLLARLGLGPLTTRQVKWLRPDRDVIYSSRIRVKNTNSLHWVFMHRKITLRDWRARPRSLECSFEFVLKMDCFVLVNSVFKVMSMSQKHTHVSNKEIQT